MGPYHKKLRMLVIDPDEAFEAELRSLAHAGAEISFLSRAGLCQAGVSALGNSLADRDVVVVGVDCAAGLALVADICGRPGAPLVIAVGGASFEGKSPEHVLVLAELRGAAAALPKPVEAADLVLAASKVVRCEPAPAPARGLGDLPPARVAV